MIGWYLVPLGVTVGSIGIWSIWIWRQWPKDPSIEDALVAFGGAMLGIIAALIVWLWWALVGMP